MKKLIALLALILVLAGIAAAGCGGSNDNNQTKVTNETKKTQTSTPTPTQDAPTQKGRERLFFEAPQDLEDRLETDIKVTYDPQENPVMISITFKNKGDTLLIFNGGAFTHQFDFFLEFSGGPHTAVRINPQGKNMGTIAPGSEVKFENIPYPEGTCNCDITISASTTYYWD